MIKIKTKEEIETMKEGGVILAKVLKELSLAAKVGVTTNELDKLARELVFKFGTKPAFLDYRGFPATLCTSINDEIVHGVPSDRKLKEGDVIKLDMGVLHKGFYTDSAVTVLVTALPRLKLALKKDYSQRRKLLAVTKKSLELGIAKAKVGNTLGDIGHAIQKYAEGEGFGVVRDLIGHGIGRDLHEEPEVPNYGKAGSGLKLEAGMVIAIEPMVVTGDLKTVEGEDGFVFSTKDGGLSAHFEHTIAVTDKGPLVLTR